MDVSPRYPAYLTNSPTICRTRISSTCKTIEETVMNEHSFKSYSFLLILGNVSRDLDCTGLWWNVFTL